MKNYRKTDQEYIEDYDKQTVRILKQMEAELGESIYAKGQLEDLKDEKGNIFFKFDIPTSNYDILSPYYEAAVSRAQDKEVFIREQKWEDEKKDSLIQNTPVPRNITCEQCGVKMFHETHFFKENDTLLLFVFACPNKHVPKKILYPDGIREWKTPISKCEKCGGKLITDKVETKELIRFKDTCQDCKYESVMEFELTPDLQITEEERNKYCEIWKGLKTFDHDLEAIMDFMKVHKESERLKKEKEEISVNKVERVNLPKLEDRLSKLSEELGYTKFKIDGHSTEKYLSVSFSAQDPTEREEKESCKVITDAIQQSLFHTNWRLMNRGVDYRLGLITGKIRAYDGEEGLMKIAREIHEQKNT